MPAKVNELAKYVADVSKINSAVLPAQSAKYLNNLWAYLLQTSNPMFKNVSYNIIGGNTRHGKAWVMAMRDKRLDGTGYVGFFAAENVKAGAEVLQQASDYLRSKKTATIYGPIDGLIFNNYRLSDHEDVLFMGEPVNPKFYFDCFKQAGFAVYNTYISGESSLQNVRFLETFMRVPSSKFPNVTVRPIDPSRMAEEMKLLYELSVKIFPVESVYCSPFSFEEFRFTFGNNLTNINPRLVQIMEDNGRPIGAVSCFAQNETMVLKTIGVLPEYQGTHLSRLLLQAVHEEAKQLGLDHVIYALVRLGSKASKRKRPGVKISRHYYTMVQSS